MCFSLAWLEQLIVWLIVIAAIVAVIRLLIPFLTGLTGMPIIGRILEIVLWAIVAIAIVAWSADRPRLAFMSDSPQCRIVMSDDLWTKSVMCCVNAFVLTWLAGLAFWSGAYERERVLGEVLRVDFRRGAI